MTDSLPRCQQCVASSKTPPSDLGTVRISLPVALNAVSVFFLMIYLNKLSEKRWFAFKNHLKKKIKTGKKDKNNKEQKKNTEKKGGKKPK